MGQMDQIIISLEYANHLIVKYSGLYCDTKNEEYKEHLMELHQLKKEILSGNEEAMAEVKIRYDKEIGSLVKKNKFKKD